MAASGANSVVTTQPCQRHHHLELATLVEMVNSNKAAMGLGDWPAPPRPPADYGRGSGSNSSRHHDEEARAAKHLAVGWGLWTIGMLISDCLVGQVSKTRRDLKRSDKTVCRSPGSSGSSGSSSSSNITNSNSDSNNNNSSGAKKGPSAKKRNLSEYTLIATVQLLLGREHGTTTGRRVTFNTVSEVKYVEKCRELYPPTLTGLETKRQAFWSERDAKDNQVKWDGHLETYELRRDGCGTACKCLGCLVDGTDTNF